jgi:hypothetical protein
MTLKNHTREQRVWNTQPDGGLIGLGRSPLQQDPLALLASLRVGHGHGGQQGVGVGVQRRS